MREIVHVQAGQCGKDATAEEEGEYEDEDDGYMGV